MRIAAVMVCLLAGPAVAHDWYPGSCCSGQDCYALSMSEVEATPEGWRIKNTGEVIPYDQARETPPEGGGNFHRCSSSGDRNMTTLRESSGQEFFGASGPVCFWAPPMGF